MIHAAIAEESIFCRADSMLHRCNELVRFRPSFPASGRRKLPFQRGQVYSAAFLPPMLQAQPRVF
jgi:hypothetical protein